MFRIGFPDASIKHKLTKHKTIINYSVLPKYCVIAVIKRFIMGGNIRFFNRFFYVQRYFDYSVEKYIWRFWILGFYFDTGENVL
jgi:hypothetical protein